MGEVELGVLLHIITFLAFPFVGGYIATRFKLPPLLGYIIGGVVMGLFSPPKTKKRFRGWRH
jgi:CPA2 family monovalent cation:H+ antiporter-2